MQEPAWLAGIDGAARRVILSDAPSMLVIAGPGTGKSTALTRRVARLLDTNVPPKQILVCTFTRTAAQDLINALAEHGVPRIDEVEAGTLHSRCFRLLSTQEYFAAMQRKARTLLDFEVRFLLEDVRPAGSGDYWNRRRLLRAFNAAWARLQHEEPLWPRDPVDALFHADLMTWLRFHGAMLIGELVPLTLQYLRDNPLAPRPEYRHVIVDEFQDLNKAEQSLIDELAEGASILAVGDDDQSIYSFKHAHPAGIAEFPAAHPGTVLEHLIECRRCPRVAIDIANRQILQNAARTDRVLVAHQDRPVGKVHLHQWDTIANEARGIATYIHNMIAAGHVAAGKVLVLAPRREFGYAIRDELTSLGDPVRSFFAEQELDGNPKLSGAADAQQAFTLLTLLADPYDQVALRCWSGFEKSDLANRGWAAIRQYVVETNQPVRVVLEQLANGDLEMPRFVHHIRERSLLLRESEARLRGLTGSDLLDALFPQDADWSEPFRTAVDLLLQTEPDADATEMHSAVHRMITQPEMPATVDYVRVMTLHKSKGLTADLVVVAGCIQGLNPMKYDPKKTDLSAQDFLEEQRRVMFVAITRTRNTLVLSRAQLIPVALARKWQLPGVTRGGNIQTHASQFFGEIGGLLPPVQVNQPITIP